jgi:plasmid stabilization system protein ParE
MKIVISRRAMADVDRLEVWLWERGFSFADGLGPALLDTARSLHTFPERGAGGPDGHYRELLATFHSNTYVIRYQVEGDTLIIGRIFHSLERR